jgi:hypothetical protein
MPPVLVFSESNGSGPTVTDNITSLQFASVDENSNTSNLSVNNPVAAGANSFEKWLRMKVTTAAMNSLSAFGEYVAAGAILDGGGNSGNVSATDGVDPASYAAPTASTSSVFNLTPETSAPGRSFTAPSNTVGSYSAYFGYQIAVASGAAGGNATFPSNWVNVQYTYS